MAVGTYIKNNLTKAWEKIWEASANTIKGIGNLAYQAGYKVWEMVNWEATTEPVTTTTTTTQPQSTITAWGLRTTNTPKVQPAPVVNQPVRTTNVPKVTQPVVSQPVVTKQEPVVSQPVQEPVARTTPAKLANNAKNVEIRERIAQNNKTYEANKYIGADWKPLTGSARELAIQRESQGKSYSDIRNLPTAEATKDIRAKNQAEQQTSINEKRKEQAVASTTQLWDKSMLNMKDEESDALKMSEVSKLKESDIASNLADRDRTLKAGEQALETFRNAVGIDKDGNVDMNRKWSIGYSLQTDFDNYKSEQTKLSSQYESARKSRVASQMRANLLARWVDISKIPQEKLIALSDEVGAQAFTDIYNNKQNTLNALTAKQDSLTGKLNDLRKDGIIAEDKYNTLKATVESQFEKTRNDIQRSYVNDIFQITDTSKAKKDAKQTAAVNTMETMLKAVSATEAPELRSRFLSLIEKNISSVDLVKAIANDQRFKELAKSLAESSQASASAEATAKIRLLESQILENTASATAKEKTAQASVIRANKTGAPKTSKFDTAYQTPVSTADLAALETAWVTIPDIQNIKSKGQLVDAMKQALNTK